MPVFGSVLAVLFLGETFYFYHAIGILLIAAGIVLASIRAAPVAPLQQNLKRGARADA
jgi:drug/metabolite transporter (DMT)-like permease